MNEALMKELVEILRAMKNGSPTAFQELVEQRALYCGTLAMWQWVMVGVVAAIFGAACFSMRKACHIESTRRDDLAAVLGIVSMVVILITIGIAVGFTSAAIGNSAEAAAPLGRALEALR